LRAEIYVFESYFIAIPKGNDAIYPIYLYVLVISTFLFIIEEFDRLSILMPTRFKDIFQRRAEAQDPVICSEYIWKEVGPYKVPRYL